MLFSASICSNLLPRESDSIRDIRSVQKMVGFMPARFAKIILIKAKDVFIVVRLTDDLSFVFAIKDVGSLLNVSIENIVIFVRKKYWFDKWLSTAINTSAWTSHDFNKMIGRSTVTNLIE